MLKKIQTLVSFLIIVAAVFWSFYGTKPHVSLTEEIPATEFSTARAMDHVKALAREPHYVGSTNHREVRNYIVSELQKMGLLVQTQEAYSVNKHGTVTRPQNIISRIEGSGNGKALLLLTHYDSAMHSSYGASDAGSGVATILEGMRAYLASGEKPVNDIIIVFTDAEELGLNGADIFVEEHPWAKDVGLALNFEARGSGGNSFMLLETNGGNKALLKQFFKADVEYPVTNSLAYSVYKMLPNDTDLTVLREQGDINGFNFAFIDDHFDYHTARDLPENLDVNTLAHQGAYLMPLLKYFTSTPFEEMSSDEDLVFFNVPIFKMVNYPYSWIFPLILLSLAGFIALVVYGAYKKQLPVRKVMKGFLPLLISLTLSGLLAYGIWQFALFIYPQYGEMENGFTYNGYYYISAVIFLSLSICFYVYNGFRKPENGRHLFVAPLFLWILISALAAFFLKGASYFIIPVLFGLVQLFILIKQPKYALFALSLLSLPAIFILMPFVVSFPVALGLKMLTLSAVLTVLLWVLLWPVFSYYSKLQMLGFLSFLTFLMIFVLAHFRADFNEEYPKPNSLVYIMDEDEGEATWNTYDKILDSWNAPYFEGAPEAAAPKPVFSSKYSSGFERTAPAPQIMLSKPYIGIEKQASTDPETERYSVKIAPNRDISRIELYADKSVEFRNMTVNGKTAPDLQPGESDLNVFSHRWSNRLLEYYPVTRDTLRLEMSLEKGVHPEVTMYEAAYSLFDHQQLQVKPRSEDMIPRPFVLNDAVIVKESFVLK